MTMEKKMELHYILLKASARNAEKVQRSSTIRVNMLFKYSGTMRKIPVVERGVLTT
jgi:hypothetical protein